MTAGEAFLKGEEEAGACGLDNSSLCLREMQEDEFLGSAEEAGVCDSFCL